MNEKNNKRTIFGWTMYDWGKSAYETAILGAIMPVYFISAVIPETGYEFLGNTYTGSEVWGFMVGSVLLIFFIIMPTIGAVGDLSGSRMKFFKTFAYGGAIFASSFFFITGNNVEIAMLLYFLAQLGATGSNVFYDSVLKDITTPDTIDKVSAKGYALGYLGGGLQLLISLIIVQFGPSALGISAGLATRISIAFAGIWWLYFSYFSFSRMKIQEETDNSVTRNYISAGWKNNLVTLSKIRKFPFLLFFLLAYLFYWDGSQTVINMAPAFATEVLLLSQTEIIIVYLVVQFVAFLGARLAGYLADNIGPKNTIFFTIIVFFIACNGAYFLPAEQLLPAIGLGSIVGLGMGGLQSVSRSVYANMLPEGSEGGFMGFFSVISRFSAIWGPLFYSYISVQTGSGRYSLPALSIFFIIGFVLLLRSDLTKTISKEEWITN